MFNRTQTMLTRSAVLAAGLFLTGAAQAALHDRGGGLLYDDVLDVTWLQDANYAKSSGYHPTGKMSWAEANKWVSTLVYHDPARNVDHTGWRLPKVEPSDGKSFNHTFKLDGTTDEGYNITSTRSEFSYMYYVNLRLDGWWTKDGKHPATFGVMKSWTAVWNGQADIGLVKNLQTDGYYCGSPGQPFPSPAVWVFTTAEGNQRDGLRRPDAGFAWAVHDGDIAAGVKKPSAKQPAITATTTVPSRAGAAHGELYDMGGGLLYDAVLDVTWLQDADYARTSGFKPNGKMPWADAVKWVSELVYHDPVRNVDIRGWRLPKVGPVAGDKINGRFCFDGTSDEGYNITSPRSELAYMFYVNLGLKGYYSSTGDIQTAECGAAGNGKAGFTANVGLVKNLKSHIYWSGSSVEPYTDRNAWIFDTTFGYQNFYNKNDMLSPWPVHDGNVAGVSPKPSKQTAGTRPVITIVSASEAKALDTYKDNIAGIRVELPLDETVTPEAKAHMTKAIEDVVKTPGLIAFWVFGENPGSPRQSIIVGAPLPLEEVGGPITRIKGGSFSGSSVRFDGSHYLRLPRAKIGALDISGKDAQVSMFAVVKLDEIGKWGGTIAGIWSEGKGANDDTGTRQYAMLYNMPTYGGMRQLTPHISAEGGVTRRADGSALPWCVDYAAPRSELPVGKWVTLGFTYDGKFIRAYMDGVMEERAVDPVKDKRTDPYFTTEGPNGGHRGMNPYYHGRGIFRYDPKLHAESKPKGPADFTVGARYAGGSMLGEALKGRMAGLAVFNRALTADEMKRLHAAARLSSLR